MLEFLQSNIATIITLIVVGLLVFLAVFSIIRSKKKGKSTCGCDCSHCPNSEFCHKQ